MEFHNGWRRSSGAGVEVTRHLAARTEPPRQDSSSRSGQAPAWGCELGWRLVRGPLTRSTGEGPHSPSGWRVTLGRTLSRSVRVSEFSDAARQLLLSKSVPGGAEAGIRGGGVARGSALLCGRVSTGVKTRRGVLPNRDLRCLSAQTRSPIGRNEGALFLRCMLAATS